MKKTILCLFLGVCLFLFISDLHAMECQIVDGEGNAIDSVAAGEVLYFKNTYSYMKSKKLSWSLTIVLPSTDIKSNKTSIKYSGYFYHQPSIENNSHVIPLVIPAHNFIQGSATFQYKLSSVGTCKIYLEITKEMTPPRQSNLSATAVFPDRVELSWNEPFDNAEVVGYRIYDSNGSYLTSVNKPSTYFDGLSVNNVYCYTVTAYDSAGNESEHSNKACATIYAEEEDAKTLLLLGYWQFTLSDGKEKIYSLTTIKYNYKNVMYLTSEYSKYDHRLEAEYLYSGRWYLEEVKYTLNDWWLSDEYYFYTDGYTILPNSYYYECSSLFCGYGPDIYHTCCLAKKPFSGYKYKSVTSPKVIPPIRY